MKQTNTYFWTCPKCGSNNDPGEQCDCEKETTLTITNLSKGEVRKNEQTSETQQFVRMFGRYNTGSGTTESSDI